ncbi:DUF6114 domain-containing protein [Paractinoplanes durhamensis]|uniref:Uncharacterized protein n=1 Tax=Paractinoplanes durhamensis TaxID=113563 RepID=A0ABQ3Z4L7_9ACTN|nr:DUF6114 domain-containing protein [Actinoplanes durhamensis]GIE04744.1 hypothetical protein Adu01nite_60940 [Actinoplanes durhamensis]
MPERSAFWRWRHARPFWGGLLVFVAGLEIFLTVMAPLPIIIHVGMQGFIGYLLPILLAVLGGLMIFNPQQHVFYALVAAILAISSWITSNLGGFIFGIVLGVVGSALAFAWSPTKHKAVLPPIEEEDQDPEATSTPGVQPDTSQSLPRHRRPSPGVLSGE